MAALKTFKLNTSRDLFWVETPSPGGRSTGAGCLKPNLSRPAPNTPTNTNAARRSLTARRRC
jgi:hypothetical protein